MSATPNREGPNRKAAPDRSEAALISTPRHRGLQVSPDQNTAEPPGKPITETDS